MYSVLGNHKTMTHRYTVNVIHIYRGIIVFTQQLCCKIKHVKTPWQHYVHYRNILAKFTELFFSEYLRYTLHILKFDYKYNCELSV